MSKEIRGVSAKTGKPSFAPSASVADAPAAAPELVLVTPEGMPGAWHWKHVSHLYGSGSIHLMVGRWSVGYVCHDLTVNKDSNEKHAAHAKLPGLKSLLGRYATQAEAQAQLIRAVALWFSRLDSPTAP